MATSVIMPKQGQSVESCIITKWYKQKGESVKEGEILFSYETDKAAFDFESPAEGMLIDIFFGEGDEVPVLTNVAAIGSPEKDTGSIRPPDKADQVIKEQLPGAKPPDVQDSFSDLAGQNEKVISGNAGTVRISPRAKRLAESAGFDPSGISGSGPGGRIIFRDIEKAMAASHTISAEGETSLPGYTEHPLSNIRKLIAGAMLSSLQNSAQLTHHMSADARKLLEARRRIKADMAIKNHNQDITLNDMICWCVIKALKKFPDANAHFLGDRIRTFNKVHLGIAVDTPRGLMVPALRNADDRSLQELSEGLWSLAEACRKGSIDPELIKSSAASFTVSNLGSYGVEIFTPVINLPQTAILGVCTITHRPADTGNNVFGFVPFLGLSLTYDHRAIDGGPATLFLKEIKKQVEKFEI